MPPLTLFQSNTPRLLLRLDLPSPVELLPGLLDDLGCTLLAHIVDQMLIYDELDLLIEVDGL